MVPDGDPGSNPPEDDGTKSNLASYISTPGISAISTPGGSHPIQVSESIADDEGLTAEEVPL